MTEKREENTADSPPHADRRGVNPAGEGPSQPRDIDAPNQQADNRAKPGETGDRTKDEDGGGI